MVMLIMASLVFVAVLRQFSGKWPNIQDPCPDEVVHGLFYSTGIASLPNVLGWLSMEHLPASSGLKAGSLKPVKRINLVQSSTNTQKLSFAWPLVGFAPHSGAALVKWGNALQRRHGPVNA